MQEKALAQMAEMRKKFEGSTGIEEERKEELGEERPLCSYCKEELEMDKYEDSPYGKIGIMSGSQLYSKAMSYTLRQLCTFYAISPHDEDMKELNLDLYPTYIAPIDLDSVLPLRPVYALPLPQEIQENGGEQKLVTLPSIQISREYPPPHTQSASQRDHYPYFGGIFEVHNDGNQ